MTETKNEESHARPKGIIAIVIVGCVINCAAIMVGVKEIISRQTFFLVDIVLILSALAGLYFNYLMLLAWYRIPRILKIAWGLWFLSYLTAVSIDWGYSNFASGILWMSWPLAFYLFFFRRYMRREKVAKFFQNRKAVSLLVILITCLYLFGRLNATSLFSRNVKCPVCNNSFKIAVVMSSNNLGGMNTNLCMRAAGFQPWLFTVSTCPRCCFSGYTEDFQNPLSPKVKQFVLEKLTVRRGDWKSADDVPPPLKYEFAALIYREKGRNREKAYAYLSASWCAEEVSYWAFASPFLGPLGTDTLFPGSVEYYEARAIESFGEALKSELRSSGLKRAEGLYLAGELSRRTGNLGGALYWLSHARRELQNMKTEDYEEESERMGLLSLTKRQECVSLFNLLNRVIAGFCF